MAEPVSGIKAELDESNAHYFHVLVASPKELASEGGFLPWTIPSFLKSFWPKFYHPSRQVGKSRF